MGVMPVIDVTAVEAALRAELVKAGIVRHPSTAGASGKLDPPPLFVELEDGAPMPGERESTEDDDNLTATVSLSGDMGEVALDSWRRRTVVDVRFRSKGSLGLVRARAAEAAITRRLVVRPDHGLAWTMGNDVDFAGAKAATLYVIESSLYAGLGRISASAERGYDEVVRYLFETLR